MFFVDISTNSLLSISLFLGLLVQIPYLMALLTMITYKKCSHPKFSYLMNIVLIIGANDERSTVLDGSWVKTLRVDILQIRKHFANRFPRVVVARSWELIDVGVVFQVNLWLIQWGRLQICPWVLLVIGTKVLSIPSILVITSRILSRSKLLLAFEGASN